MSDAFGMAGGYLPTVLDADLDPDGLAAWAADQEPGSAVVTPLAMVDPRRLSGVGRVDALIALDKQLAWLQARQHKLLVVMAAAPQPASSARQPEKQWVREEVACALHLSPVTAGWRLAQAEELSRLPGTLNLLERGEITGHHARVLAEATRPLDDAAAAAVEARVLGRAPDQSVGSFRASVRRAVLAATPQTADECHQEALAERRISRVPLPDGMTGLWSVLSDTGAATVWTACDAYAGRIPAGEHRSPDDAGPDDRSADQRRADALVQICLDALHGRAGDAGLPRAHRLRPAVQVTIALSTLLGLDEQSGELDGHGPIGAALARRIAADPTGTWRRLVVDELGRLVDYGTRAYRPPQALTNHVVARDRTCRFPHCTRAARRCELDHRQAREQGGPTNADNLHILCARHHHLKHEAGWATHRTDDGDTEWTSPTGHRYLEPAATYPIDHTPNPPTCRSQPSDPDPPSF